MKQPGLQRRASFESFDATNDGQPRVLRDLLSHGAAADGHLGEAHHALLVAPDQRDEGRLVTRAKAVHQVGVVVQGA